MKNKRIIFAGCAIGVSIVFIIFTLGILKQANISNEITVELKSGSWKIVQKDKGIQMDMEGFHNYGAAGLPILPNKVYRFLIPSNTVISNVQEVRRIKKPVSVKGRWNLGAPVSTDIDADEKKWYTNQFDSSREYPVRSYEIIEKSKRGPYTYVSIKFWPVQRAEKYQNILVTTNLWLKLKFESDPRSYGKKWGNTKRWMSEKDACSYFNNYSSMQNYYQDYSLNLKSIAEYFKYFEGLKYDYVIITTNWIYSANKESINKFKKHKESKGFSVAIITEDIYGKYSGNDITEKVRNFLKDKYEDWGIEYVLIVGGDSDIPMKRVLGEEKELKELIITYGKTNKLKTGDMVYIPTDCYFADLDGDWDKNGNGNPGEMTDLGVDGVDFDAEVIVGRIPTHHDDYCDEEDVSLVLNRIIQYENSEDYSWRNSALLIGAFSNYAGASELIHDSETDKAVLMEYIDNHILKYKEFNSFKLYEEGDEEIGSPPSDYYGLANKALTQENVIDEIDKGYGLVVWGGHGSSEAAFRRLMNASTNKTEDRKFIEVNDSSALDDMFPPIIWSCSCNNSYPETYNLMHALLKSFSVANIGATKTSWYSCGWDDINDGKSETMTVLFVNNLLATTVSYINVEYNNGDKAEYTSVMPASVGDALAETKKNYYENYFSLDEMGDLKNNYVFTLYGDPSLKMYDKLDKLIDLLNKIQSKNLIDYIKNLKPYEELYKNLSKSNKLIPTLLVDLDKDGLEELIIFPDAQRSGKALIFDSPDEGLMYLGSMRFNRKLRD